MSDRNALRQEAARVFGIDKDVSGPTELEQGLAHAERVFESGAAAVAIAASGMDEGSLARLRGAFDPEDQPPAAA